MRAVPAVRAVLAGLTELRDLALPARCVGCTAPGVVLCPACLGSVTPFVVDPAELADSAGPPLLVHAAGAYEAGLRAAVIAYKERGRRDVVGDLACVLTDTVEVLRRTVDVGDARLVLVAVPSTRAAARARGGQHVLRLARAVGVRTGLPIAPDALRLQRVTRDSAGLGVEERQANLSGALTAARPPRGSRCAAVVVDDVVTTGATLAEAVRALRAAGWDIAGAAVVAATARRIPRQIT